MKSNTYKMCSLNESALSHRGLDKMHVEDKIVAAAPVDFANAVSEYQANKETLDNNFKGFVTNAEEFVEDNQKREKEVKTTTEMKKMHLSESLFEDASVDTVEEPVKKRPRAENEKKWIGDYSSEDLWLAVYDELSATTDNEGAGQQVDKQIRARRGERYEHVYPHGDTDIVIYATKPEEFEFARKVADHYGVVAEEPKLDNNKRTNGFYKYSMIIRIPEDGLYSED